MLPISNIYSKPTRPVETKFHVEPPRVEETEICSNHPGHMITMAAKPIYGKSKGFLYPHNRMGQWGLESTVSCAQLMKGGTHLSPLAALAFPNSKKVPIYCWGDRKRFSVVAWRSPASNLHPYGDFLHNNRAALTTRPRRLSFIYSNI